MKKIVMPSISIMVTEACTLKCKLCLAYVPYYKNYTTLSPIQAEEILKNYFAMIESVDKFSITGGEPLINPHIIDILFEIFKYSGQINQEIILITNGTIRFSTELLDAFEREQKMKVIINNYGVLSKYADENYEMLIKRNINSILYTEENRYGWIDCRDHSLKHISEEEKKDQASHCAFFRGKKYVINRGRLYTCTRAAFRIQEDIIPYTEGDYIDLLASGTSAEANQKKLQQLFKADYTVSCAYCDGLTENRVKYKAAEQL